MTKHTEPEEDVRPCYVCGTKQKHINDGGNAWIAYKDGLPTIFYCSNEQCSAHIVSCCDGIDVVDGSRCPKCKKKVTVPTAPQCEHAQCEHA